MKKILLILFVLIFNFSYSIRDIETEKKAVGRMFNEKMSRQINAFSECHKFKKDMEDTTNFLEEYMIIEQEAVKMINDLHAKKINADDEEFITLLGKALRMVEILESKIDHLHYFHGSEIPEEIDFIAVKKRILDGKAKYQLYLLLSNPPMPRIK